MSAAKMEDQTSEPDIEVVEQLTTGFGAMLEQVEELARRNHGLRQQLEQVRERVHEEVRLHLFISIQQCQYLYPLLR